MKKSVKMISTLLMIAMIICTVSTTCLAANTVGNVVIPEGNDVLNGTDVHDKIGNIITTLRNIALILAVVVLIILGIKYMMGSVEEKAEYKKSFIPLIVGIIVVVAAVQIAAFIYNLAD